MLAPAAPTVTDDVVTWRVEDPRTAGSTASGSGRDFDLGDTSFTRVPGGWELEVPVTRIPPVDRLEYLIEETRDGRTVLVTDPANPQVVAGAFGDHSWVSLGYREPAWLRLTAAGRHAPRPGGRGHGGRATSPCRSGRPTGTDPDEELPLLLSHDGPEMDHLGELTRFVGVMTPLRQVQGTGGLPPDAGGAARAGAPRRALLGEPRVRRRALRRCGPGAAGAGPDAAAGRS